MRKVIATERAPGAVGPYSQAIVAGGFVWVSGQIALDPASGQMVQGEIEDETRQVMGNLRAVLDAAGSSLDRVVRATVYLADLNDFERVNAVYADSFGEQPPARVCIEACGLPKGARVEIDAIAEIDESS
ncbi:MAG: RidA family protein [Gemmatimonadetes bacterium]|nr:RidA family protein [Gemmatimonadota bacterium]